jgi:hypothetical protein
MSILKQVLDVMFACFTLIILSYHSVNQVLRPLSEVFRSLAHVPYITSLITQQLLSIDRKQFEVPKIEFNRIFIKSSDIKISSEAGNKALHFFF